MWNYEKRLEYPINIKETNPKIAQYIMSQYGGPYCANIFFSRRFSAKIWLPHRDSQNIYFIHFLQNVFPEGGRFL